MTEKRAEEFLEKIGLTCEPEPDWVSTGRKPDFFCSGGAAFWCEVKTFGPTNDFKTLGDAFDEMRTRAAKITSNGRGFIWMSNKLDHRDARVAMSLLERSLSRFEDEDAPDRLLALIPKEPCYDEFVRFSIATNEHPTAEVHSCASATKKYGLPFNFIPNPYSQSTTLHFSCEEAREVLARDILTLTDDFRLAIEAWPTESRFDFLAIMPTGAAKELNNPDRIREAVSEANSQFKNATTYKSAPCLLTIFHDAVDVPEDEVIKSALYGDLKYVFSRDRLQKGKLILDGNGAWNESKNRTTSAVLYIRNNSGALVVHNYWADDPFPRGLLPCKEIVALEDGTFQEAEPPH